MKSTENSNILGCNSAMRNIKKIIWDDHNDEIYPLKKGKVFGMIICYESFPGTISL